MERTFFMTRFQDLTLNLLRIVTGLLFMQHGAQKLFGWLREEPGPTAELFTMMWTAGVLEFFGGLLIVLGLLTRPVAFILAGEMAVAYFMAHMPRAFWPIQNGGELSALYSFVFLFLSAHGPGRFSVDAMIAEKKSD